MTKKTTPTGRRVETYDLIVVGAGPAGLSFVRALEGCGLSIAIVERQSRSMLADPPIDGRDIALTQRSEGILRDLGIWPHIPVEDTSFIRHAKVINGGSSYALHFDHRETGKDYLGTLVANNLIRRAAFTALQEVDGVELIDGRSVVASSGNEEAVQATLDNGRSLQAPLLVAADSRFSETRRRFGIAAQMRDFGRSCIVCRMDHDEGHGDTAFECFHYGRTLAILPLAGRQSSVVITLPTSDAAEVMAMDEQTFNQDITVRFARQLGRMRLVGERHIYPLVAVYADRFYARRFALIGDAAVGMHPVTAHGFNLGLRGAARLAVEIRAAHAEGADIGAVHGLRRYHLAHDRVARPIYLGTNMLVGLYTDERLPARVARDALLRLGNLLHPARHAIMRQLTDSAA
ncbi:MAG: 5-demethoxyubiquinol-8 5-hydroxylase UbiM [Hyphomicrobiales bacterium]|nr:5-demethoxyubiquinol-8 5-hydroxylase UbiM [Hyphomicrobiales bacterium]